MHNSITFTPTDLVGWCAALVTIAAAVGVIVRAVKAAQRPNVEHDARIADLEKRVAEHDKKLHDDAERFQSIEEGNRVTQRALLALLDHGLDGNNLDQMREAKDQLQRHLIER